MEKPSSYRAIGLMSGTSLDGVDAALIVSDGQGAIEEGAALTLPYPEALRAQLRSVLGARAYTQDVQGIEASMTDLHAHAVQQLLDRAKLSSSDIDVVGFHGQTLAHDPTARLTFQIGDAERLARALKIDVVHDFRSADVHAGGQGAPLLPLYHYALAQTKGLQRPLAVVNIGGVANLTGIGPSPDEIVAFDTGPGNALINDWVFQNTGKAFDAAGGYAARGTIHHARLRDWLNDPYFVRAGAKSLDRNHFAPVGLGSLSLEDGAATLTAFTAQAIGLGLKALSFAPQMVVIVGGGRHNETMLRMLRAAVAVPVKTGEEVGFSSDHIEAQGFAYLAIRSLRGWPISLPGTTGVPYPLTGGRLVSHASMV